MIAQERLDTGQHQHHRQRLRQRQTDGARQRHFSGLQAALHLVELGRDPVEGLDDGTACGA
ncbi:MAG: hypothetical protein ACN6I7_01555 [bacterium]